MNLFQVLFHLVWPRELFLADRAREHLALLALVIQERMPLEAVFVFKTFIQLHFLTFKTAIRAIIGHLRIF
jgi:hypothetical protein